MKKNEQNPKLELFCSMAEGVAAVLPDPRGYADVAAVMNWAVRLSLSQRGENDPGVVSGTKSGVSKEGAPYSKPATGKVRVRCSLWDEGDGCEVRAKNKKNADCPDLASSSVSSQGCERETAVCTST